MMKLTPKSILNQTKSLIKFPWGFYSFYKAQSLNKVQKAFALGLTYFKPKSIEGKGILLIQMVHDYEFTIKFAAAGKAIAQQYGYSICFYDIDWSRWIGWTSRYEHIYKRFIKKGLEKIYLSFCERMIFKAEDKYPDQAFIRSKLSEILTRLNTPKDILEIRFENVLVGDLIYDTYLRYFHQPTIEKINKDVENIIEIALNIYYNFNNLLKHNHIKTLIVMYSSYLQHGIPARICLNKGIDVYSIGSYLYVLQKLSKQFPFHQINHSLFSPEMQISDSCLALAEEKFTSRFDGNIDPAVSYMRQSSYAKQPLPEHIRSLFKKENRNIVIYAHDFFDSPHVNRLLQFPDLYQFLKQTLNELSELKDTSIFIKIHPNGISGCKEKAIDLVQSFNKPHFHILDESISNLNIVSLNPDLVATARGTIGLEMAYFGIPTVALFDNLYANFKFVHTCFSTEEYFAILKGQIQPSIDFDKGKIYSFYYQAYLRNLEQQESPEFTILSLFKGDTYNDKYLDFLIESDFDHLREAVFETFNSEYTNNYGLSSPALETLLPHGRN